MDVTRPPSSSRATPTASSAVMSSPAARRTVMGTSSGRRERRLKRLERAQIGAQRRQEQLQRLAVGEELGGHAAQALELA